jgi:hypothetical protein
MAKKKKDKKLLFMEMHDKVLIFFIQFAVLFWKKEEELFVNNKINRKRLNAYVSNFKWVIEFLIKSKSSNPIRETLKTKQLNYKFKSYFLVKAPDQMPNTDEDDTQIWQAGRETRCEIQNIIRFKELTFDEVIERVESMAQIDIEIITNDFLYYKFVDRISFFNDEEVCKKYSFNYFYDKFYKEFKFSKGTWFWKHSRKWGYCNNNVYRTRGWLLNSSENWTVYSKWFWQDVLKYKSLFWRGKQKGFSIKG